MELRPNVEKKPQAYSEALRQRPETRQKSRFSIEPLEERIAPKTKVSGCDPGYPEPY